LTSAFVDTSVILAVAFQEADFQDVAERLERFDAVYASDLLEAELRSACRRDQRSVDERLIAPLRVVYPPRSIRAEVVRVLDAGYARGADCFHLATALFLVRSPSELTFLTLDKRQRDVAATLGFAT
jgi:predicted nucleic acid-binding protein